MGLKVEGEMIFGEEQKEKVLFDIDWIEAMKNGLMRIYLGEEDITDWLLTPVAEELS